MLYRPGVDLIGRAIDKFLRDDSAANLSANILLTALNHERELLNRKTTLDIEPNWSVVQPGVQRGENALRHLFDHEVYLVASDRSLVRCQSTRRRHP